MYSIHMIDDEFKIYVENFYNKLIEDKYEYLKMFSKLQIQIEGWFRGELMHYFNYDKKIDLKPENREVKINAESRKKVDLKIPINGQDFWIELKHILVGIQGKGKNDKSLNYPIKFYFSSKDYIANDIKKLREIENGNNLYSLSFISTNNDMIKDENELKKKLDEQLEQKAELVSYNYNKNLEFGYFLLKVYKD